MLHTHFAALALAAITLAASGCGGSSKTVSTTTAAVTSVPATTTTTATTPAAKESANALTSAQLIASGDAICARINAKRASTTLTKTQDYARLVPPLGAYEQAEAAKLSKLTPPASMASEWKQIASGVEAVADDTAKIGQDIKSNRDNAGSVLLTKATKIQVQTNAVAKRAGFKDCAQF